MSEKSIHRLVNVLDEDQEGNIQFEEYYYALEAYNCRGEQDNQFASDPQFVPFQLRSVYKLIKCYTERKINHDELFRMIDLNGNGQMELTEFIDVIKMFSDFKIKEIATMHQFFDIDNNGIIPKEMFCQQLKKAEQKYRISQGE